MMNLKGAMKGLLVGITLCLAISAVGFIADQIYLIWGFVGILTSLVVLFITAFTIAGAISQPD